MKLLQSNVFEGNKLNCFNATQVLLRGPTQILIYGGPKQLKVLPDKLREDLKFQGGGAMNLNDAMTNNVYIAYSDQI